MVIPEITFRCISSFSQKQSRKYVTSYLYPKLAISVEDLPLSTVPVESVESESTEISPVSEIPTIPPSTLGIGIRIHHSERTRDLIRIEEWLARINFENDYNQENDNQDTLEQIIEVDAETQEEKEDTGPEEQGEIVKSEECPICTELLIDKPVMILDCDHEFCTRCIYQWMQEKFSCPICRASIGNNNFGLNEEDEEDAYSQDDDYSTGEEDHGGFEAFNHEYDEWGDCVSCGYPGYNDERWENIRGIINSELGAFMQDDASEQDEISEEASSSENNENPPPPAMGA